MVGVKAAVNRTESVSPGEPKKVQFTCSYTLYPTLFTRVFLLQSLIGTAFEWKTSLYAFASHNAKAIQERTPAKVIVMSVARCTGFLLLCLKSYLFVWIRWRRRPWVVIWYLTRSPEAGWSSWLFTALSGGANYRRGAEATPLNSDYRHFVTPGGLQVLSFKPVINIYSNLIVCAETT